MNDVYLKCLFYQFSNATGLEIKSEDYEVFLPQFSIWIRERLAISRKYIKLLKQMGIDIDKINCLEIGKGRYDSLANHTRHLSVLTLFNYGIDHLSDKRIIIKGNLEVKRDGTTLITSDNQENTTANEFSTYMTYNPYIGEFIKNWGKIPNNNRDIVIGMFGNTYDKDHADKRKILEQIRKNSNNEFVMGSNITNNQYCYALSNKKRK